MKKQPSNSPGVSPGRNSSIGAAVLDRPKRGVAKPQTNQRLHGLPPRVRSHEELLELALSEVLERTLDEPELERTLARLQTQTFKIMLTERLTPLAFPLYADRLRGSMSTEAWSDRLSKLLVQHSA